mmetsp:Transcript_3593/g.7956  ORF Transcript_3593/g.7956 Transcript_3593/m.7956 type:complete len:268 (+) Transcript_3593:628-1431(+)
MDHPSRLWRDVQRYENVPRSDARGMWATQHRLRRIAVQLHVQKAQVLGRGLLHTSKDSDVLVPPGANPGLYTEIRLNDSIKDASHIVSKCTNRLAGKVLVEVSPERSDSLFNLRTLPSQCVNIVRNAVGRVKKLSDYNWTAHNTPGCIDSAACLHNGRPKTLQPTAAAQGNRRALLRLEQLQQLADYIRSTHHRMVLAIKLFFHGFGRFAPQNKIEPTFVCNGSHTVFVAAGAWHHSNDVTRQGNKVLERDHKLFGGARASQCHLEP